MGSLIVGGGGGVRGVGAEGSLQTSRWGNSGCCGCDWDLGLRCVDSPLPLDALAELVDG